MIQACLLVITGLSLASLWSIRDWETSSDLPEKRTVTTVYVLDDGYFGSGPTEPVISVLQGGEVEGSPKSHGSLVLETARRLSASNVRFQPIQIVEPGKVSGRVVDLVSALSVVVRLRKTRRFVEYERGVILLSLTVNVQYSRLLYNAVRAAQQDGLVVISAAGNGRKNACGHQPANLPQVLSVGALIEYTPHLVARTRYSNYGPCVDIFAQDTSFDGTAKGTSFASARLAGHLSAWWTKLPEGTELEPQQLFRAFCESMNLSRLDAADLRCDLIRDSLEHRSCAQSSTQALLLWRR